MVCVKLPCLSLKFLYILDQLCLYKIAIVPDSSSLNKYPDQLKSIYNHLDPESRYEERDKQSPQ
jgi:hypothetical protein